MLAARSGLPSDTPIIKEIVDKKCSECHTSCGQCHISRPDAVLEGLVSEHTIYKTPSDDENCTRCHGSRVGEEFNGAGFGNPADVHKSNDFGCLDCHCEVEFHGTGKEYAKRYDVEELPRCEKCHVGLLGLNDYHIEEHMGKLQCQVCHSRQYKNCYQCHVGKEEKVLRFPSEMDFRIGRNPLKSQRRSYDFVVLRHPPIAPDSFDEWDIELTNFTSLPTWKYASPHNIRRYQPQTASCRSCHDNTDYFLTTEYIRTRIDEGIMVELEMEANRDVILDSIPELGGEE